MKLIKFSIEVRPLKLIRLKPARFIKIAIEEWVQEKYSSLETLNNYNSKNKDKKENNKKKCQEYNASTWYSIDNDFLKYNIIKEESLLVASHEKRKINYYIYKASESNRKYKKEVSLDVVIMYDENRNIDMIANEVIKHIKRKLWFLSVSIVKENGATIYFEKNIKEDIEEREIKTISADILENSKITLVEKIYSIGVFVIGIFLIWAALKINQEQDLKGILISIGTSLIAATIGFLINSLAELYNKGVKISIIDLNSLVEEASRTINNLVTNKELESVEENKLNRQKENSEDEAEQIVKAIGN